MRFPCAASLAPRLFAVLAFGVLPAAFDAAQAEPWSPYGRRPASPMGGGFLEMVMTGRDPERRLGAVYNEPELVHYGRPAVRSAAPYDPYADPLADVAPLPSRRRATLPEASLERPVLREVNPVFQRQTVRYDGPHGPGTIIIDTPRRFLYLVGKDGTALRYGIGVGRPGFEWAGAKRVTRKAEWPDWRPPEAMLRRRPDLPRHMVGGPANPLGARALYLGSSLYRIHGTNEPHTIGEAVSSGCIRMRNEDVIDLYNRVRVGTVVHVI